MSTEWYVQPTAEEVTRYFHDRKKLRPFKFPERIPNHIRQLYDRYVAVITAADSTDLTGESKRLIDFFMHTPAGVTFTEHSSRLAYRFTGFELVKAANEKVRDTLFDRTTELLFQVPAEQAGLVFAYRGLWNTRLRLYQLQVHSRDIPNAIVFEPEDEDILIPRALIVSVPYEDRSGTYLYSRRRSSTYMEVLRWCADRMGGKPILNGRSIEVSENPELVFCVPRDASPVEGFNSYEHTMSVDEIEFFRDEFTDVLFEFQQTFVSKEERESLKGVRYSD
jgi:hypothetical protein